MILAAFIQYQKAVSGLKSKILFFQDPTPVKGVIRILGCCTERISLDILWWSAMDFIVHSMLLNINVGVIDRA